MTDNLNKCSVCGNEFTQRKNLYAHLRNKHNIEPLGLKSTENFPCNVCDKTFTCQSSLTRHLRTIHKLACEHDYASVGATRKTRLICPEKFCDELPFYDTLRQHLAVQHGFEVECESLTFNSMEEFNIWKDNIQQRTFSLYTKDTGCKSLKSGVNRIFFNCHRSYCYSSKGNNIRVAKSMGSNKIGKACPSRIELTINEKTNTHEPAVSVKYWKSHCGHTQDIGRITINRDVRLKIAGKLKEGVTFEHVLDSIRDSGFDNDMSPRLLLLDRKDIHNIVRDFNIQYATKCHSNDAVSVKLWIQQMNKLGTESPVLYYKEQRARSEDGLEADDFVLILMTEFQAQQLTQFGTKKICIDGTHGTNGYDFQLYTVVIVDEFGSGCPVAYCFSNRSDEILFQLYFNTLKSKVGTINAEVFMSDDAPAFYNAWAHVMSPVPHRLLCTWHIDKNWRQNLNKISGGSEKKAVVYKTLRVLLQLTSVEDFEVYLEQVVNDLLNDNETKAFGDYFKRFYCNRVNSWAYCYRLGLGINTNMYLESLHKILKYIYLEGKKIKRLDKSICAVMKLARDSYFKRLIKLSKNVPTEKMRKIHLSHVASNNIELKNITVVEDEREWIVMSSSNSQEEYQIIKAQETCDIFCLMCKDCNICIHTYKCSCVDNLIKMNICKHIHAVAREFSMIPDFKSCNSDKENIKNNEIMNLMEMNRSVRDCDINKNQNLRNKTELLLGLVNTVNLSNDSSLSVEKHLDRLIEMVNKLNVTKEINFNLQENINTNKKIDKQVRLCNKENKGDNNSNEIGNNKEYEKQLTFYSTKKKVIKKANLQKPTINEKNAIISGLCDYDNEAVNVHCSFDHTYT